jgi:hypothetical protein
VLRLAVTICVSGPDEDDERVAAHAPAPAPTTATAIDATIARRLVTSRLRLDAKVPPGPRRPRAIDVNCNPCDASSGR